MKHEIFNQYANKIASRFEVPVDNLFKKDKKTAIVDARHLLYFMCYKRPMSIAYIEKYMAERGYIIKHNSIIHGVRTVESKMEKDKDYQKLINELSKSI